MKIFLDTVELDSIAKFASYNIIDGVTTNPSLMSSSPLNFSETIKEIISLIKGDVSVEVVSNNYEAMISEGYKILDIDPDLIVKLPITWDGIKACSYFAKKNIKTNMTLCFNLSQALLAARAGAYYVSPFIGRLEDIGENGIDLISNIRSTYDTHNILTEILAASVRTIQQVEGAMTCGAHAITLPSKVLSTMIAHPLTDKGLKKFNDDWSKSAKSI